MAIRRQCKCQLSKSLKAVYLDGYQKMFKMIAGSFL